MAFIYEYLKGYLITNYGEVLDMITFTDKIKGDVIIRILKRGEDIYKALLDLADEYDISAGIFNMIGAVSHAVIGYFDDKTKEYKKFTFNEDMEIVSCMGNFSKKPDGTRVVHAHIALGDSKGNLHGGHLFEGTLAGATGEIFAIKLEKTLIREKDEETQLFLINKQE